jgi:hypothetical protein
MVRVEYTSGIATSGLHVALPSLLKLSFTHDGMVNTITAITNNPGFLKVDVFIIK